MEHIEKIELETYDENGEETIKIVEVTYDVRWEDNSFSYSYGSIDAVHEDKGWGVGYDWDTTLYTEAENKEIERIAEIRSDDVILKATRW